MNRPGRPARPTGAIRFTASLPSDSSYPQECSAMSALRIVIGYTGNVALSHFRWWLNVLVCHDRS